MKKRLRKSIICCLTVLYTLCLTTGGYTTFANEDNFGGISDLS